MQRVAMYNHFFQLLTFLDLSQCIFNVFLFYFFLIPSAKYGFALPCTPSINTLFIINFEQTLTSLLNHILVNGRIEAYSSLYLL